MATKGVPVNRPYERLGRMPGHRALSPSEIATLVYAYSNGVGATALASEFGISRRSVYRWVKAKLETVTVDGWTALFVIRPTDGAAVREGPVQLTEWRRLS